MHFLKYIELHNYLNLKHAKLKDLKDFNIIIGPNNCGKTSLLRAVNLLNRINFGRHSPTFSCETCQVSFRIDEKIQSIKGSIGDREKYLARTKVRVVLGYNKAEIMKLLPRLTERQNNILSTVAGDPNVRNHLRSEFEKEQVDMKEQTDRQLVAEHASPIIWNQAKTNILNHILFCPEARLQNYKGEDFTKFIGSEDFDTEEQARFIDFIKETVARARNALLHMEQIYWSLPI